MKEYPFKHDGPVYVIHGERFDSFYYSRNGLKYVRRRDLDADHWWNTQESRISDEEFYMTIACIERGNRHA